MYVGIVRYGFMLFTAMQYASVIYLSDLTITILKYNFYASQK